MTNHADRRRVAFPYLGRNARELGLAFEQT